jgi:hypothetical protein
MTPTTQVVLQTIVDFGLLLTTLFLITFVIAHAKGENR